MMRCWNYNDNVVHETPELIHLLIPNLYSLINIFPIHGPTHSHPPPPPPGLMLLTNRYSVLYLGSLVNYLTSWSSVFFFVKWRQWKRSTSSFWGWNKIMYRKHLERCLARPNPLNKKYRSIGHFFPGRMEFQQLVHFSSSKGCSPSPL